MCTVYGNSICPYSEWHLLALYNERIFISASSLDRGYMIWSRRVPKLVYGLWGTWNIPSEGLVTLPEKAGHKSLSTLKTELFPVPLGPSENQDKKVNMIHCLIKITEGFRAQTGDIPVKRRLFPCTTLHDSFLANSFCDGVTISTSWNSIISSEAALMALEGTGVSARNNWKDMLN